MAISINWSTKVITVPQADLTLVSGSTYSLDLDWFRLELKDIEDNEDGMVFLTTHNHVAPITFGTTTLARVVEIINGYTVTFQDVGSPYAVELINANSNVANVTNINNVSVRSNNSAGLVQVNTGSVLTPSLQQIRDAMQLAPSGSTSANSVDDKLDKIKTNANLIPALL